MENLALNVLDMIIQIGAAYADVRVIERHTEDLSAKNGQPDRFTTIESQGLGVRVLADGAWGFASTSDLSSEALQAAAHRARASAQVQNVPFTLPPRPGETGTYSASVEKDPLGVSPEMRLGLLIDCTRAMQRRARVRVAQAEMQILPEQRWFVSSEGSRLEQIIVESGGGVAATAVGNDGVFQRRSFEDCAQAGYEFIDELDLPAQRNAAPTNPRPC